MATQMPRSSNYSLFSQMPNGYVLPEGRLTPNTIFVGGIDPRVKIDEMKDFFGTFGTVKDVKIITYRGGFSKGYGFVYFDEDVDIKAIIDQHVVWKGKSLKLGPAIVKQRSCRARSARLRSFDSWGVGPDSWGVGPVAPTQYVHCSCCPSNGACMSHPPHFDDCRYYQTYTYPQFGNYAVPQMPMNAQSPCVYQYIPPYWTADQRARHSDNNMMDCGFQTMLTVL
ncbi:deleted in azoospermia-like [Syngnathus scovelli]|uniref:deleted in azoospermia-like n=1 Tax=Syngnathus scovelli TaxID=161590 RepID=UPI0021102F70|nr:deleted in azoospermia-like [Syngnathus scovelli]